MTVKKESPAEVVGHQKPGICKTSTDKISKRPSKIKRVLKAFLSGKSYNRWEASYQLRDWTLHSTVSTLKNQHGIEIARKYETVPGYLGTPTRCCRYWLASDQIEKAEKLLEVLK